MHGLVRSVASEKTKDVQRGISFYAFWVSHSYLLHTNKNNKRPESWTLDQNKQLADKDCMRGDAFDCHMTIGFGCSVFTEVQDFRGPSPYQLQGRGQEHTSHLSREVTSLYAGAWQRCPSRWMRTNKQSTHHVLGRRRERTRSRHASSVRPRTSLSPSFHPIVCPQIAMDKLFLVLLLIWFRGHVHPPKQPFNVF